MAATKKKITAVGIIQGNGRAVPREVSQDAGREKFSYKVMWENVLKKISLHSYVVNMKSSCKKNVPVPTNTYAPQDAPAHRPYEKAMPKVYS